MASIPVLNHHSINLAPIQSCWAAVSSQTVVQQAQKDLNAFIAILYISLYSVFIIAHASQLFQSLLHYTCCTQQLFYKYLIKCNISNCFNKLQILILIYFCHVLIFCMICRDDAMLIRTKIKFALELLVNTLTPNFIKALKCIHQLQR